MWVPAIGKWIVTVDAVLAGVCSRTAALAEPQECANPPFVNWANLVRFFPKLMGRLSWNPLLDAILLSTVYDKTLEAQKNLEITFSVEARRQLLRNISP